MDSLSLFSPDDKTPQKTCTGPCGRTLDATSEFFGRYKDGLKSQCKQCVSEYNKAYNTKNKEKIRNQRKDYYEKHSEHLRQYSAQYRANNSEKVKQYNEEYMHTDKRKAVRARSYAKHREENRAYAKKWYAEHREQQREYREKYNAEHHEERLRYGRQRRAELREELNARNRRYRSTDHSRMMHRIHENNRRARKLQNAGSHTKEELHQQLQRQKNKCYYCHKTLVKYHADHVVPLSKGGSNDISNIVIACPTCNTRKNNKLLHEWLDGGRLC